MSLKMFYNQVTKQHQIEGERTKKAELRLISNFTDITKDLITWEKLLNEQDQKLDKHVEDLIREDYRRVGNQYIYDPTGAVKH